MSEHESFIRGSLTAAKYRDPDGTKRDVIRVITNYRGLKPVYESFVFNNGTSKKLLALSGTIPVNYKGSVYHIPIMIWLLDTHPYNAPMVFVNPTPDMRIKVSRHVDHNGKVYLPYLHDWKHGSSELELLIQVLICTFQEQPPVYSVLNSPPQLPPQHPMMGQATPPNPLPYPVQNYGSPYPPMPAMPMPGMPIQPHQTPQQMATGSLPPNFSMRPSLLSATEEKLTRRLEDVYLSTEILQKTGDRLKEGQQRLDQMVKRLAEEKQSVQNNMQACRSEIADLDVKIAKAKVEEADASIDDAIQAPMPLYRQIVSAYAEDAALEDTIYYLGDAFRQEKMDLEIYLKNVRVLSRRQFRLRATLQKCRQKAGLAG